MISIALTNYNNSKFLKEVVQSIVIQDYTDWEIIFVDDCSKDNSVEIFKNLVEWHGIENKVKICVHEMNLGYGASLADAIELSTGDLIAVVDSDDALAVTEALGIMVREHDKYPDVSMTYSNYFECRDKLHKERVIKGTKLREGEMVLKREGKKGLSGNKVVVSHLKVFKRKFYDMTQGIDRTLRKAVDKNLIFLLEEVGKLLYIDKTLYIHRAHSTSISWTRRTSDETRKLEEAKMDMYKKTWERRNGTDWQKNNRKGF